MTKRIGKGYKLTWNSQQVQKDFIDAVAEGWVDVALTVEKNAKAELYKGHGVITGTLRRSIHIAQAGYDWAGDNTKSESGTPERGNKRVAAILQNGKLLLQVGSGMVYALWIEMGGVGAAESTRMAAVKKAMRGSGQRITVPSSFTGYRYLRNGLDKTKPLIQATLKKRVERKFPKPKKK